MSVAEYCQPVRTKLEHEVERVLKRHASLFRKSVNEIGIDALETQATRIFEQFPRMLERLYPAHGQLDIPVEVLNAHADSIESEAPQSAQVFERRDARIDFNRIFTIGGERKSFGDGVE